MHAKEVRSIFMESMLGNSSKTPTSDEFYGPDVDQNSDSSKRRCMKCFVKINFFDNVQYGLYNLTLGVEEEVLMNYGN
jgi:hypothetical protein